MSMSPAQCRAARGWIDWSQEALATAAGVSLSTVRDFEKGRRTPIGATLAAMKAALEREGVTFFGGDEKAWGITHAGPEKATAR